MLEFSQRHQRLVQVTESNITELMASVDFILMGLGGVYWLGKDVFPGSSNVAEELKKIGQHIVYFTNNDMHTREFIKNQLINIGIKDVKLNEICSLSHATAVYLRDHLKISDGVFCLGPSALLSELKNNNVEVLTAKCDCRDGKPFEDFLFKNKIKAIVMGIDVNFSYRKARALSNFMLHHPNVLYLATNMQPNYVRRNSRLMPGVKAQSKMIKELSGRKPDYVIGKPEEPIFRVLMSQIVIDLSRTLLIGHRLETDVLFAYRAKISSMLVLSGMASLVDARKAEFSDRLIDRASCPDFFVENIQKLHELLHKQNVHQLQERKMTIKNMHLYLPRVTDGENNENDSDYFVDQVVSKNSIPIVSSRSKPLSLVSRVTGSQTTNVKAANVSHVTNTSTIDDGQLNVGYYMKNVKYTNYKTLIAAANEAATELLSDNN